MNVVSQHCGVLKMLYVVLCAVCYILMKHGSEIKSVFWYNTYQILSAFWTAWMCFITGLDSRGLVEQCNLVSMTVRSVWSRLDVCRNGWRSDLYCSSDDLARWLCTHLAQSLVSVGHYCVCVSCGIVVSLTKMLRCYWSKFSHVPCDIFQCHIASMVAPLISIHVLCLLLPPLCLPALSDSWNFLQRGTDSLAVRAKQCSNVLTWK